MSMKEHWTKRMFIDHTQVLLDVLFPSELLKQTRTEVESLLKIFQDNNVPSDGKILDVACGIGRHAISLAEKGYRIIGIDISPHFIEVARKKAESTNLEKNVKFMVTNMTNLLDEMKEHKGSFDAIISMFTSFGYYDDDTNTRILREMRTLAKRQAIIVLDVINRDWLVKNFRDKEISDFAQMHFQERRGFDPKTSRWFSTCKVYDKVKDDLRWKFNVDFDIRVYSLHELISLARNMGWLHVKTYGSLNLDEFKMESDRLVFIGRAID